MYDAHAPTDVDPTAPKPQRYAELVDRVRALVDGEPDAIANLANVAAELHAWLPDLNWVGFYLLKGDELVVGPFQGRPACTRIALGRGVCGTAAATGSSQVVPDVAAFPGHIACDARSRSEVVVPVVIGGGVVAVLDLDSPSLGRFDDADRAGLEAVVAALAPLIDWGQATRR
ncbi:MAG: GAF domain-containing protein [bacterium]|jgi:L-methionine (R)-S-oxide reductase|nr:GAF domain-containing protein [bacterium]